MELYPCISLLDGVSWLPWHQVIIYNSSGSVGVSQLILTAVVLIAFVSKLVGGAGAEPGEER